MKFFDEIFEGTTQEQHCKASHFLNGAKQLCKDAETEYAACLITGMEAKAPQRLADVHRIEEVYKKFTEDPRALALQAEVDKANAAKREQVIRDIADRTFNEVFGKQPVQPQ